MTHRSGRAPKIHLEESSPQNHYPAHPHCPVPQLLAAALRVGPETWLGWVEHTRCETTWRP